ncbi:signal-transducing adaptor protein 1-like [Aulostomus maculatus]
MAKRPGRQRIQLSQCYYEGYLDKRSFKDKKSRKLWTCLCGNTLYFFSDKRDIDYAEKLDLSGFISITDDDSVDCKLDAARLKLQMADETIRFTAPNGEARELWKGFIHSVTQLKVLSSLNLLPGQIHMLKEAVEQEKERIKNLSPSEVSTSSPPDILQADMPSCFHNVSRLEAELLLDREAKRGNLLLRLGRDGKSFAVTMRLDLNGSIVKHYRVTCKPEGGFIIDVDNPVPCATLHEVISYLVEKTDGALIPFVHEETYEKKISFIRSDKENGERTVEDASSNLVPSGVPKRVTSRIPAPRKAVVREFYENVNLETAKTEDTSLNSQSQPDEKVSKRAMMLPIPTPRQSAPSPSPSLSTSVPKKETRLKSQTDHMGQTISELKLKFEKRQGV